MRKVEEDTVRNLESEPAEIPLTAEGQIDQLMSTVTRIAEEVKKLRAVVKKRKEPPDRREVEAPPEVRTTPQEDQQDPWAIKDPWSTTQVTGVTRTAWDSVRSDCGTTTSDTCVRCGWMKQCVECCHKVESSGLCTYCNKDEAYKFANDMDLPAQVRWELDGGEWKASERIDGLSWAVANSLLSARAAARELAMNVVPGGTSDSGPTSSEGNFVGPPMFLGWRHYEDWVSKMKDWDGATDIPVHQRFEAVMDSFHDVLRDILKHTPQEISCSPGYLEHIFGTMSKVRPPWCKTEWKKANKRLHEPSHSYIRNGESMRDFLARRIEDFNFASDSGIQTTDRDKATMLEDGARLTGHLLTSFRAFTKGQQDLETIKEALKSLDDSPW